jgi:hypothetical protein
LTCQLVSRYKTLYSVSIQIKHKLSNMGNIFNSPPPPVPLFIYECGVVNSKKRKCFRAKVHKLAEKHHARIRPDSGDGITYDNDNLKVLLVFEDELVCEHFQSAVREIPLHYRKRGRDLPEDDLAIRDSVTEVSVSEFLISNLKRVFYNDYQPITDDHDPNRSDDHDPNRSDDHDPNRSTPSDAASDFTDSSYVSAVFMSDEVRLRLVDLETSMFMFRKKPEKCHLKSPTKYPDLKNDPNNIVYLSRQLHEYFDGISQQTGVPAFTLNYVRHDPQVVTRVCDDNNTLHVYETTVSVVFRTELDKTCLSPYFKDHRDVTVMHIEFCLYFEDPVAFEEYATFKALDTGRKWASLAGTDGVFDD